MSRSRLVAVILAVLLIAALGYLREPPWLIRVDSGFRPWERAADGTRFRWTGGHASFYVPASGTTITVPIRTTFGPGEWTMPVTITIDDRLAAATELRDEAWQRLVLQSPGDTGRRVRRVDIRTQRTRSGNRGVAVGEVEVR